MKTNKWVREGVIFSPNSQHDFAKSHAMVPTPLQIDDKTWRIYYSSRNSKNQSAIFWFNLRLGNSFSIEETSKEPILMPGRLGCFDDNGVTPSCLIYLRDGSLAMYYIGWNPGSTTRVNLYGGLAISRDHGLSFERWSEAPILERCQSDPLINTAPWVIQVDGIYRMFYVSGTSWESKDEPRYLIKTATSHDGLVWIREGKIAVDYDGQYETALARPYVIHLDGKWWMWFSSKRGYYSIKTAQSEDCLIWHRSNSDFDLDPNLELDEKCMVEYAAIINTKDKIWMLYNGDDYGKNGISLAWRNV